MPITWRATPRASRSCASASREWTPQRAAELTGIAAEEIVELAREYATTRPAAIRLNYGVQRSERGAMAVRAIALLPALTGSWKEIGGGLQLSTSQAFHLNRAGLERADLQQQALGREARIVNMAELGSALTREPPVKALVVYNSNPAAIAPNQNAVLDGLRRADLFTVVLEQFQNDTADYADYPAAGHHLSGAHRPLLRIRPLLSATRAPRASGARRGQVERRNLPPAGRAHGLRRRLLPRFRRRHDPHASRFAASVCRGITLEELDREHSVRLRLPQPFLPFAAGGFGSPAANAISTPRRWTTRRPGNRGTATRSCGGNTRWS